MIDLLQSLIVSYRCVQSSYTYAAGYTMPSYDSKFWEELPGLHHSTRRKIPLENGLQINPIESNISFDKNWFSRFKFLSVYLSYVLWPTLFATQHLQV